MAFGARCRFAGLLIEAEHVPCGVTEAGRDFRRVRSDGLHQFTTLGNNRIDGRGNAIDH